MRYSWEKDFRPQRPDGRHTAMLGAYSELLRRMKPELALPADASPGEFAAWREAVRAKMTELLRLPDVTEQPEPRLLDTRERDGYRVEKWEFYPDAVSAVPVLVLVPDHLGDTPAPGVLCLPGNRTSKEWLAGEPSPDHPEYAERKYPDRNAQAVHMVKAGYVAAAFDNPGTCERCFRLPFEDGTPLPDQRQKTSYGLLEMGYTYPGISVFEKLCFLSWFKRRPDVDADRIAVIAHSLGTQAGLPLAVICDDVKAYVHNDFVYDLRWRYVALTDMTPEEARLTSWMHELMCQIVPGSWRYFGYPDLLAAVAPKFLAMNEGGADPFFDTVTRGYAMAGARDRVQITHYPKYADPATRPPYGELPMQGMSLEEIYRYSHVDAPDHSFRAEPTLRLLRRAFG